PPPSPGMAGEAPRRFGPPSAGITSRGPASYLDRRRNGILGRLCALGAATTLFFASGATGLAYEVIWFRRFSHIWGASTLAMAAVVSSFLLGLGIGAHILGRAADRARTPLKGYAWCEAAIGLLALLIPYE